MSCALRLVDQVAKGRGYAMAEAKVTRCDGTVEYHVSRPDIKPWNLLGWAWYFAHRRDLERRRT